MWRCRMLEAADLTDLPIAPMRDTVLSPHGATQVVRFLLQANKTTSSLKIQHPHVDVLATPPNLSGTDYVYLTTDIEGVRLDKIGDGAEVGPIDGVRTTCYTVSAAGEEWRLELMSTPSSKVGLCHLYSGSPIEEPQPMPINAMRANDPYAEAIGESQLAIDYMLKMQNTLELARSERDELDRLRIEVQEVHALRVELEAAKREIRELQGEEGRMPGPMSNMRRTPPQRRQMQRSDSPPDPRMLLSPMPGRLLVQDPSRSPTHQPTSLSPHRQTRDVSPPPSDRSPVHNAIQHPRLGVIMAPTYEPSFQPSA